MGEVDAMNWACTVCGYSIEGVLPQTCPDCGANLRFEEGCQKCESCGYSKCG